MDLQKTSLEKILHISNHWPSFDSPINGLFLSKLIQNFKKYSKNKHFVFVPRKIVNKERSIAENIHSILSMDPFLEKVEGWGIYVPAQAFAISRGYNAILSKYFLMNKLRRIVTELDIDVIQAHAAVVDGYLAYQLFKEFKIPFVIHVHGGEISDFKKYDQTYQNIVLEVYKNAAGIICNSKRTQRVVENTIGNYSGHIEPIPFGIDLNEIQPSLTKNKKVQIVSVARLIQSKRIDLLINAINNSGYKNSIELTIIGDGVERNKLQNLVSKLGLNSQITFTGYLNNDEVRNRLPLFDLFVLPAEDEGFGVVYLEALAAGLPAVGVKGEGCSDIAEKTECILLIERGNLNDLVEKIDKLVGDNNLREKYHRGSIDAIKNNFSWPLIVETFDKFYSEIKTIN